MNAENMNVNSASVFFRMVAIGGPSRISIGIFTILKKSKTAKRNSALMVFHYHGNRAACGALQDENKGSHEV
jgi:hypothetical protein